MARFNKKDMPPEVAERLRRAAAFILDIADADGERFLSRTRDAEHDELMRVFARE